MQTEYINYENIPNLNIKDKSYILQTHVLDDFIQFSPDISGLKEAMIKRQSYEVDRKLLKKIIEKQYSNLSIHQEVKANIDALIENHTFTVTTGHQPCLLGGPAYYIYKICSVIHLCNTLNTQNTKNRFVPIFINSGEDHDFEEIKSMHLYQKTIFWDKSPGGPVGRFTTENLEMVIDNFCQILGLGEAAVLVRTFKNALTQASTYNEFIQIWVNTIFGKYGLICLDMDDVSLKRSFLPHFIKELTEKPSAPLVLETQQKLYNQHKFKAQAQPREINIFYMEDGLRERIVFEDGVYRILGIDKAYTEAELIHLMEEKPENFSPNVITRPLYQEFCLPNIAYIGGGGEIAYWLERKTQFNYFNIFFPVLIRRNSIMFIPESIQSAMKKLELSTLDLFEDTEKLIQHQVQKSSGIKATFEVEKQEVTSIFDKIAHRMSEIDKSLVGMVKGEEVKTMKTIEHLESKFIKAIKQKEDVTIQQVTNIKSKLFPSNSLQERYDSVWQFTKGDNLEAFIDMLVKYSNPLDKRFLVICI